MKSLPSSPRRCSEEARGEDTATLGLVRRTETRTHKIALCAPVGDESISISTSNAHAQIPSSGQSHLDIDNIFLWFPDFSPSYSYSCFLCTGQYRCRSVDNPATAVSLVSDFRSVSHITTHAGFCCPRAYSPQVVLAQTTLPSASITTMKTSPRVRE